MANCSNCQWGTFKGKTPTYHDYWCQCWSLYMPSWESCDKWESKKEKSKKGTLMGTCRKCKFFIWKSYEEEQEGICSLQPERFAKTGLNHYCSRFEQKGASMAFCGDCREWEPTEHSKDWGWCPDSQLEKHKFEEACGCIYLKGGKSIMGTCKECKWWGNNRSYGFSECGKMMCAVGSKPGKIVERYPTKDGSVIPVVTFESFGCVHFEQKSEGPFKVKFRESVLGISLGDDGDWLCVDEIESVVARRLCSWLNEHWRK